VGNLPEVFERSYQQAYLPFLEVLEGFPGIRVALHYSGVLLEWFRERHPELLSRLRGLVERGQVEMMGGGFYEPILSIIPDADKVGQVERLSAYLESQTGCRPRGMWLAERIWEPHLARPIREAGMEYTVLDDYHFQLAGLREEALTGYYLTEEQGHTLALFPISEKLRYLIPFAPPEETVEYLLGLATPEGDRVMVLADDGEKFGVWPGTHRLAYGERWLERFFTLLGENAGWLKVRTFGEVLDSHLPAGRVYLPNSSYREMNEWSGGFWRNYLVRYPESNNLHKKMLRVREKIAGLEGEARREALDHLWKGQCNCAYWHGIFGGLYLNYLRSALYENLIAAEVLAERAGAGRAEVEVVDFDRDGSPEVLAGTDRFNLYLDPAEGGILFELDFKPRRFNLVDTLTRRPEAYHATIRAMAEELARKDGERSPGEDGGRVETIHHLVRAKERGLERWLQYDLYRRACLVDHFFPAETTLRRFSACDYHELGDFVSRPYRYETAAGALHSTVGAGTPAQAPALTLKLWRDGTVRAGAVATPGAVDPPGAGPGTSLLPVRVEKLLRVAPGSPEIHITYRIVNGGGESLAARFGVEFNFSFLAGSAPDRYYYFPGGEHPRRRLQARLSTRNVTALGIRDEWKGIDLLLRLDTPATVWRFPIETVSQSEAGFERTYQHSAVVPHWPLSLEPGEEWETRLSLVITEIRA